MQTVQGLELMLNDLLFPGIVCLEQTLAKSVSSTRKGPEATSTPMKDVSEKDSAG